MPTYSNIVVELDSIQYNMGIFKPYASPLLYSTNYMWFYDTFMATGDIEKLQFPLLTYVISRTVYVNGVLKKWLAIGSKNYNNIFDNSVLTRLQEGDTIAIQTGKRYYFRN